MNELVLQVKREGGHAEREEGKKEQAEAGMSAKAIKAEDMGMAWAEENAEASGERAS